MKSENGPVEAALTPEQTLFMDTDEEGPDASTEDLSSLWSSAPNVEKPNTYQGPGLKYGKDYGEDSPVSAGHFSPGTSFHDARTARHVIARALLKRDHKAALHVTAFGVSRQIIGRPRIWGLLKRVPGVEVTGSSSWKDRHLARQKTSASRFRRALTRWADRKLTTGEMLYLLAS